MEAFVTSRTGLQTKTPVFVCVCVCVRDRRKKGGGNKEEGAREQAGKKCTYVSLKAFRQQQGHRDLILGMSISLDLKKIKAEKY